MIRLMGERLSVTELDSPIGRLRLAASEHGIVRLGLPLGGEHGFSGWLREHLADSVEVPTLPSLEQAAVEIDEYFEGRRKEFGVPLDLRGTAFQLEVWRALCQIPFGQTCTYAWVGRAVGSPDAARAVGSANASNPIPLLVPCHRVIAAGGKLGGYTGGLPVKRRLLALEGAIARENLL